MVYNEKEIMDIVHTILGDDATGIYIHRDVVNRDLGYDDEDLISTIGKNPWHINSTKNFEVMYGMTKLCIYPRSKKIPWVIKIPITAVYCHADDENDENEGYDYSIANKIGDAAGNVCEDEIDIYDSCSSDAQNIMAENYYIGKYNNIPIYIQEKVIPCECDVDRNSKFGQKRDILNHEVDFLRDINSEIEDEDFVYNVILSYGIARAVEIFEELGDIDDLHSGNYGYNNKGEAMIFDYAGYDFGYQYSFDVA